MSKCVKELFDYKDYDIGSDEQIALQNAGFLFGINIEKYKNIFANISDEESEFYQGILHQLKSYPEIHFFITTFYVDKCCEWLSLFSKATKYIFQVSDNSHKKAMRLTYRQFTVR